MMRGRHIEDKIKFKRSNFFILKEKVETQQFIEETKSCIGNAPFSRETKVFS